MAPLTKEEKPVDNDTKRVVIQTVQDGMNNGKTTRHYRSYYVARNLIRTSGLILGLLDSPENASAPEPRISLNFGQHDPFRAYQHWLRTRRILTRSESNGIEGSIRDTYNDLILLWAYGRYLKDDVFRDMVMSRLVEQLNSVDGGQMNFINCLDPTIVGNFYKSISAEFDAPMQKLFADAVARFAPLEKCIKFHSDPKYPVQFLKDVMLATVRERDRLSEKLQSSRYQHDGLPTRTPTPQSPDSWLSSLPTTPTPGSRPITPVNSSRRRSSIKKDGNITPGGTLKNVTFQGHEFTEDECRYHLHCEGTCTTHCKGARSCWKKGGY